MSRIIRLQAEGFKRLVAVDITPEGDLIEIRGNNGEGKSSVLDAIFAALGGADAAPVQPVRKGEEYALIKLDLGDLKVTRYFGEDGATKLKVENAEGAVFTQGQTMLDKLVGSISFDPLEFARMDPKAQAAEIRRLVKLDVDLDDLAAKDKADFEARREINRDARALAPRIEAIVLPAELPEAAPDKDAIVAELAGAAETNSAIERGRAARESERRSIGELREGAERLSAEADELEKRVEALRQQSSDKVVEANRRESNLAALPALDEPIDVTEVQARLADAERVLAILGRKAERDRLSAEFQDLKARSEALTAAMEQRAKDREAALAAAKMPVDGLGFATIDDDLLVTFNGVPFSQASAAEQLRVSTSIAMAANPTLRVLRIKDGSLLDKNSFGLLAKMASDNDFQIWAEFVGDEGAGIIMEAGAVKGAPEPERVEPPKRRKAKGEGDAPLADAKEPSDGKTVDLGEIGLGGTADGPAKRERKKPAALDSLKTPTPGTLL